MTSEAYLNEVSDDVRQQALQVSGLMECSTDERLQMLVKMTGPMLGVMYCVLDVMVDGRSLHVASWPNKYTGTMSTSEMSLTCAIVMRRNRLVVISDTDQDDVLSTYPPFLEHDIHSFLGIPVRSHGDVVGSFSVFDVSVRDWGYYEVNTMVGLARLAGLSVDRT